MEQPREISAARSEVAADVRVRRSSTPVSTFPARFLRERLREFARGVPKAPFQPTPSAWSDRQITLAWLGHASVLINFLGVRILTDPTFFSRIGIHLWVGTLGPKRMVASALSPAQLPPIDLVLVSHAHFDHLDRRSLAAVPGRPAAVMAANTSDLLPRRSYGSVQELRWGEDVILRTANGEIGVRAIEVRHWGARVRRDTHRGYTGYVLEREGRKLLFGGDTANTPVFAEHRRHGPFEAAIMPIGGYDPWINSHCTPEESIAMADAAGARMFLPIHHQSFKLSDEPTSEPLERTEAALAEEAGRLGWKHTGQTVVLAR